MLSFSISPIAARGLQDETGPTGPDAQGRLPDGLPGYLLIVFRAKDVRVGTLGGEDKYGNKYHEDNKQFCAVTNGPSTLLK